MTESTEHDRYAIVDNGGEYSDHRVYYMKVPAGVTCAEALDVLKAYDDASDSSEVVACFASEPIAPWGADDFCTVAELVGVCDIYYEGLDKCPERLREPLGFPSELRVWIDENRPGEWLAWRTHPYGYDVIINSNHTQEEAVAYATEKWWAVVTPDELAAESLDNWATKAELAEAKRKAAPGCTCSPSPGTRTGVMLCPSCAGVYSAKFDTQLAASLVAAIELRAEELRGEPALTVDQAMKVEPDWKVRSAIWELPDGRYARVAFQVPWVFWWAVYDAPMSMAQAHGTCQTYERACAAAEAALRAKP
jgi:hypothetical protein